MPVHINPPLRGRTILADPLHAPLQEKSRERNLRQRRAATSVRAITAVRNDLLPDLIIAQRPIADLLAGKRRLRKFNLDDIVEAARSIERFGFLQPVVVGRDGCSIIDGELRMEGARWLGMEHIPCLMLSQFSSAQERALRIVLNRLGQRREWDIDVLKLELEELIIEEEDISGLGLDDIELDQILQDEVLGEDAAPEPRREVPPVTHPGDLWQLGEHRLLCGDALAAQSYERLMEDEQAQLLLSDPPYNIKVSTIVSTPHDEFAQGSGEMSRDEYGGFLGGFITQASERLVAGAVAFLFIDWRQVELMLELNNQNNQARWAEDSAVLTNIFAAKTREDWCKLLEGTDACFAPVLTLEEAAAHPHNRAREQYTRRDGALSAAPAPRFSN